MEDYIQIKSVNSNVKSDRKERDKRPESPFYLICSIFLSQFLCPTFFWIFFKNIRLFVLPVFRKICVCTSYAIFTFIAFTDLKSDFLHKIELDFHKILMGVLWSSILYCNIDIYMGYLGEPQDYDYTLNENV